jgi:aerobic-type carbon monoxide dehydrogenase small subunit (CoxS/CutS family)
MSLDTLLQAEPEADAGRIREVLSGHLCRCTGYHQILDAAVEAARALRKETQNA